MLPGSSEYGLLSAAVRRAHEDEEDVVAALTPDTEGIGSGAVSNPVMDVLKADVVLLIGANPVVNHPVAATWIKNAVKNGTKLIVADPRRSERANWSRAGRP